MLSRRKATAFGIAKTCQIKLADHLANTIFQVLHAVDQAKNAEILVDGQVVRELGLNGREVRAAERLGTAMRKHYASDRDLTRIGFEDP